MRETFLCAKYNRKMDIAVKQEEAFQDGFQAGIKQGIEKVIDARNLYANGVSIELIAKSLNMSVDKVKEIVSKN